MIARPAALMVLLASLSLSCATTGAAGPGVGDAPVVAAPAWSAFRGPFATFAEICGALRATGEAGQADRHERCSVRRSALSGAGPFVAMATFFEGRAHDGNASLALKTARGWFVRALPDGRPFGGGLSHHTPSSEAFDAASTRLADGALRVVSRGHASSFAPGRGALGSSSRAWTSVRSCGLRDGRVACSAPRQVYSEVCRVSEAGVGTTRSGLAGPPVGARTCERTGRDVR